MNTPLGKIGKENRLPEILLVEDNYGDVLLTQDAFRSAKVNLHVARKGEEAMNMLRQEQGFAGAQRPDLILLDLNLPGKDGKWVLKEIKDDDNLKSIPVIILTSSKSRQDIDACYKLFANSYIIKPADQDFFREVVQSIEIFWFRTVELPEEGGNTRAGQAS